MYSSETRIYIAVLIGVLILLTLMTFFIVTIIRYQRKKVAFHMEKIKEEFFYLDKERERIALDLHDDLGASLSSIKLRLQCLKNMDEENTSIIENSELLIDQVMQRLREISFNMMPGVLQRQGLNEALKELIDLMMYNTRITVNYQCNVDSFDNQESLHIYRIVQEILNNTVKHAGATLINFTIDKIKDKIILKIKDNGIGFNKNKEISTPKGSGLRNIDSRANLLGAKIYLTTGKDKGVDYLIEIPA
jgi:signal transduction histidine kinase